jgi:hypothetical protein
MDQQGRRVRLLGHLRLVARELQMAASRLSSPCPPTPRTTPVSPGDHLPAVATLLDQVVAGSTALAPLRQPATTTTAP